MSMAEFEPDAIVGHVTAALSAARVARAVLDDVVIPTLAPARRTSAQRLARRLAHQDFFTEDFVRDLGVCIETLHRRVEEGTHVGWEADENHTAGGYEVRYRSEEAASLAAAARHLAALRDLTAATLDVVRAHPVAMNLFDA